MISHEIRVRRPSNHGMLIKQLTETSGMKIRDLLLITAGIGFKQRRSEEFQNSDERIRWDLFESKLYAVEFISMLALTPNMEGEHFSDDELADRLQNRVKIFEEYACGGLTWIQEEAQVKGIQAIQILLEEVEITLLNVEAAKENDISQLLGVDAF